MKISLQKRRRNRYPPNEQAALKLFSSCHLSASPISLIRVQIAPFVWVFLLLCPSDLSHFLRTLQERITLTRMLSRPWNQAQFCSLNKRKEPFFQSANTRMIDPMLASSFRKFWTISRYPLTPLQLISSICFLLFHKTERTSFIPNPIRPPLLFPLLLLRIREPCSLSPLFLSRGGDPAHLSLKTRMKSQLHSYFITPPLILFWRKHYVRFSLTNELFLATC